MISTRRNSESTTEYHGAEAYGSMQVVADVLKRAKELKPEGVREALVSNRHEDGFWPGQIRFLRQEDATEQTAGLSGAMAKGSPGDGLAQGICQRNLMCTLCRPGPESSNTIQILSM